MIENYKKQGLQETQNQFLCSQRKIFLRGIPKYLIMSTKIDLDHLTCQLCGNIIWKAVACSQNNCFANFCEYCVSNYSQEQSPSHLNRERSVQQQVCSRCPKCSKPFQKTSIPLVNNLLSELSLKCYYQQQGCLQSSIRYDSYLKHCLNCDYRKVVCEGCKNAFLKKQITQHRKMCQKIMMKCSKCLLELPQLHFNSIHTPIHCLEEQLAIKTQKMSILEEKVSFLHIRLNQYQGLIQKIIKGDNMQLPYQLYSSFPTNFQFLNQNPLLPNHISNINRHNSNMLPLDINSQQQLNSPLNNLPSINNASLRSNPNNQSPIVKLAKASYNSAKQKFDFLHFYITTPIRTQSPVGFQWKMVIKVLKGNLLIGICSSLQINSVDFVINRFGELKKKQSSQNKYRLIRKGNLIFTEGDVISFKYLALRKILRIENQTKKVECRLQGREIMELGDVLYSFYSLDTAGDMIKFVNSV